MCLKIPTTMMNPWKVTPFALLIVIVLGIAASRISPNRSRNFGEYLNKHSLDTNNYVANLTTCDIKPGSVYDGDTLTALCQGRELKIRFACVDSPEKNQPGGIDSRDYLRSLLERGNNQVKLDPTTTDQYGRTVAELWVDQGDNWELVQSLQAAEGMVWGYEQYKSDCKNWEVIASAQASAQAEKKGIWTGEPMPPWEWRKVNK